MKVLKLINQKKIIYIPNDSISSSINIEENEFSLQQICMKYNNNEIFCEEEKDKLTQNPTYNQQNYTYIKKYFQIASNLGNTKAMDNLFLYWYNIEKDYLLIKKFFPWVYKKII